MPPPKCPDAARGLGYDGRVVLEYVVGVDGRAEPASVHVLRSNHFLFERPAVQAVLHARFAPARKQGQPVRMKNQQRFTFVMGKS
ncbi:MAG TPA: energy transducer TonB [Gemmatimonadales bacterium]|nr:energy transducer TonB [Gemmatimonadales bacterium]